MATDITPEIRQALETSSGPLELVDRQTNRHYFVIQAEVYQKLLATLDFGPLSEEERISQLQAFGRASGWEDPDASVFDGLEPR